MDTLDISIVNSKLKLVILLLLGIGFFTNTIQGAQQGQYSLNSYGSIRAPGGLGWLVVDGAYIKNENGEIINLRGAAIEELNTPTPYGVNKYWGQENGKYQEPYGYTPNSLNLLQETGTNCVRLSINWFSWMAINHPNNPIPVEDAPQYREAVDYFIQELNKREIYVYLDFHAADTLEPEKWKNFIDNYLDEYYTFWENITQRYKDTPGVMGAQLYNEPRSFYNNYPYDGFWWDFMLETAQRIHAVNPRIIVMVASTDNTVNGTHLGYPADAGYKVVGDQFMLNPLPEPNILYVFHFHFPEEAPNWDVMQKYVSRDLVGARDGFEEFLYLIAFRAMDAGLPVMNCEFNVKHFDYMTGLERDYPYLVVTDDFLDIMNMYGCHWTWWLWKGSVGYAMDSSPETNYLVYMSDPVNSPYVWNQLSNIGETWKQHQK